MTKYSKYLNTFFFGIAALAVIDFMTRDGIDSAARYLYKDFEFGITYRTIDDWLLLTSLFYLLLQEWSTTPNKRLSAIASIVYTGVIMIDIHIWLWWTQWSWLYYYITIIHTIPILIAFSKLKIDIKPKQLLFIGLAIIFIGFLFDVIFINIPYPDMTDEIFDRNIIVEKTRNMIYYVGFVSIAFGMITLVKKNNTNKQLPSPWSVAHRAPKAN
ncbi:hypothetical protein [Cytophaga aurantiaca]|uniref:hypothetical protein n=1 Tax=Cytophaga aurantiaca TaxID=29530 RepID=UPI000399F9FE|nr:hypothetical protein [Cytophaga aurantiaca]